MKLKLLLVIVGAAALTVASFGQGFRGGMMFGGGGGSPTFLLMRDDVKRDLGLTDDQKSKLQDLQDGIRQRFRDAFQNAGDDPEARRKSMEGVVKSIVDDANKVLTADQQKRLREVFIQVAGSSAVATQPDIQKDLAITDDQKSKLADLVKRRDAANAEIRQKVQDGDVQTEDVPGLMQKNQKILNDEVDKILTKDQKDKLKVLSGKTFKADPPPTGGG